MIKNILIGTILVLVMMASAGANGGTVVKVDPASQTIAAGDAFHVEVIVENVTNMKACGAILNFDPGVMQVTGIIEGDFLKTGGGTIGFGMWDNTTGTADFSYALTFPGGTPVTGSGTLATIEFEACTPADTCDLSLTDVELIDASDEEMPTDVSNGAVTITPPIPVPALSGIGMIVLVCMLAIVLAISVTRRRGE